MKRITVELNEMTWDAVQMVIIDNLLDNPPWEAQSRESELIADRLTDALRKIRAAVNAAE